MQFTWADFPVSSNWESRYLFLNGLPLWLSWWRIHLQRRRPEFYPWAGKIPWRRERLSTPVFWLGKFHGLYGSRGLKELDTTESLSRTIFSSRKTYSLYSKEFTNHWVKLKSRQPRQDRLSHWGGGCAFPKNVSVCPLSFRMSPDLRLRVISDLPSHCSFALLLALVCISLMTHNVEYIMCLLTVSLNEASTELFPNIFVLWVFCIFLHRTPVSSMYFLPVSSLPFSFFFHFLFLMVSSEDSFKLEKLQYVHFFPWMVSDFCTLRNVGLPNFAKILYVSL